MQEETTVNRPCIGCAIRFAGVDGPQALVETHDECGEGVAWLTRMKELDAFPLGAPDVPGRLVVTDSLVSYFPSAVRHAGN
jgi:hypothetical protein